MKVTVDRELCCASGMCEMTAPEVFLLADSGDVEVDNDEVDAHSDKVRRALIECPTQALTLIE
ncbi:ferredoxin [Williamsia phyllosphaerae]|uniref:Ferredoxin n=1 Tax=Williamsia phyllosphaerae TaxID=885042 RepID=A0ABQ1U3Y8_9NOCA|nr:ferredoxin [Williamsia phyllosphaerae]GGF08722.1 hypothetical protein GCM10007298_00770 [Williamsia phyllosphaerae]